MTVGNQPETIEDGVIMRRHTKEDIQRAFELTVKRLEQ